MSEIVEIKIPNLGGVKDSRVIEVLVSSGQEVDVDTGLITLESDKASMEIPSPYKGIVKQVGVAVGDTVNEGDVIVQVTVSQTSVSSEDEDDSSQDDLGAKEISELSSAVDKKQTSSSSKVYAGPFVRRMAFELGIDLSQVPIQEKHGRVTVEDMKRFLNTQKSQVNYDLEQWGELSDLPLTRMQQLSAKHLINVWQTVPQVTQHHQVDITELERVRKEIESPKITVISFVMKIVVQLMQQYPSFNSVWSQSDKALVRNCYHVGFAVETDQGLIVPVCQDVDKKTIEEIAQEIKALSQEAREGKISTQKLTGGCATISSLGGIGGGHFTPIVNAPEAFIIGLSRASYQPVYINDSLEKRLIMPFSLTYDHRLIDGALGARFVVSFAQMLSDLPKKMGQDILRYKG